MSKQGVNKVGARHTLGFIAFSDTIKFASTEVRLELRPFSGGDEDRIRELQTLVTNFTCRMRAEFDDMILLSAIQDEILSSHFANQTPHGWDVTVSRWIAIIIKSDTRK